METVNPKVPSTIEAAALCKMADRGQITGALLDGPLALDNAISPEAAAIKNIVSPVAGRANVLVVPDLEAGNMLAKSLSFLAGADAAGIVLGARVPIILTSRADSLLTRLASCAVAVAGRGRPAPARDRHGADRRSDRGCPKHAPDGCIAVLNAGSSSIKFALYERGRTGTAAASAARSSGIGAAPRPARSSDADGARSLASSTWADGELDHAARDR